MRPYVGIFGIMLLLSGCLGGGGVFGCGAGYDEMHGGDYDYQSIEVDSDGTLSVIVHNIHGSNGYFRNSDEDQEEQRLWVNLVVEMADGSTKSVKAASPGSWAVSGDSSNGSYWSSILTFTSPAGTCDDGCERVKVSIGLEDGVIYYDGTCDSSPWVDV